MIFTFPNELHDKVAWIGLHAEDHHSVTEIERRLCGLAKVLAK